MKLKDIILSWNFKLLKSKFIYMNIFNFQFYIIMLKFLGFEVCTFLFFFLFCFQTEKQKWTVDKETLANEICKNSILVEEKVFLAIQIII
jgi:hypothetical protein